MAMHFVTMLYCPFPTVEAARKAAKRLLEARLVACCNLLPAGESLYRWQGRLETAEETILIAKTLAERSDAAIALIGSLHPYECPAILAFPVQSGKEYAAWVAGELKDAQ